MNNFQNQVQGNPYGPQMPQKPDNYLVWAILSTLLCCLPFGIVAIVKSSKVDTLWYAGNHGEAIQASNDAKKWSIISAVVGLVGGLLYVIFYVILVAIGVGAELM